MTFLHPIYSRPELHLHKFGLVATSTVALLAASVLSMPGVALADGPGFECLQEGVGGGAPDDGGAETNDETGLACGSSATALGPGSIAVGSSAGFGTIGNQNTFVGLSSGFSDGVLVGSGNTAIGALSGSFVAGSVNSALGVNAGGVVTGGANSAIGFDAGRFVTGDFNTAIGRDAGSQVVGSGNVANGLEAGTDIFGDNNLALGTDAGRRLGTTESVANANISIGLRAGGGLLGTTVVTSDSISIGTDARASADGAVALGAGATATMANQMSFGTAASSYTLAGVTSDTSRGRQSGPLEIVTTDNAGNLAGRSASNLGLATSSQVTGLETELNAQDMRLNGIDQSIIGINRQLDDLRSRDEELAEGIAVASALENPDLYGDLNWAVAVNYGNFEGTSAIGVSAIGVIGKDFLVPGDSVAMSGALGAGFSEGSVAGRIGFQIGGR